LLKKESRQRALKGGRYRLRMTVQAMNAKKEFAASDNVQRTADGHSVWE